MMEAKLPVLISIPHGGDEIPKELAGRTLLREEDIFEDGDALTRRIYHFGNRVEVTVKASVARAFVDLNRSPDDRPPKNPDGVVKTVTVNGDSVYKNGLYPKEEVIAALLKKYHEPYHRKLEGLARRPGIVLALDCHSMLPIAPRGSKNPGQKRPMICLSNAGDALGNPTKGQGPTTCPATMIQRLAECLRAAFDVGEYEVRINSPFQGGHIIRSQASHGLPWIQLEINRSLYLQPQWYDPVPGVVATKRITWLRETLLTGLAFFFDDL